MSFYSAGIFSNYYGGQIGLVDANSNTFFVNGNLTNDVQINSGSGSISLRASAKINAISSGLEIMELIIQVVK